MRWARTLAVLRGLGGVLDFFGGAAVTLQQIPRAEGMRKGDAAEVAREVFLVFVSISTAERLTRIPLVSHKYHMAYLTHGAASKTLSVLSALGFDADAVEASRPCGSVLYVVVVEATWLPRAGSTVRVTDPSDLHGFGAAVADINEVERLQQFA